MYKILFLFFFGLIFFLNDHAGEQPLHPHIFKSYKAADGLFNLDNPTSTTDQKAIRGFETVIEYYKEKKLLPDSLLLLSYIKKGIIQEVYNNYQQAKKDYLSALRVKGEVKGYSDSIYFPIYLYTGSAYYHLNHFDSARIFFEKAEQSLLTFPVSAEKNRLFNSFGALYYELGNYRQSHNYFIKALELTAETDKDARINLQINIAATAIKLQEYETALHTYQKLISGKVYTDEIYQNMGKAYKSLGKHIEALYYFKKVNPDKVPAVINEIALAFIRIDNHDSAEYYFTKLSDRNPRVNATDLGTRKLYHAYLQIKQQKFPEALNSLQHSIVFLSGENFTDTGVTSNPSNFTGTFTSYKLFEALVQKGKVFHELYKLSHRQDQLSASLNAFESAIALITFREQSFDTDEARLFIKNNTPPAFEGALRVCLELYKLTGLKNYLEKGFLLIEKNKASVLSTGVRDNRLKKIHGVSPELLNEERNIKWQIARLLQKGEEQRDTGTLQSIAREKRDFEIRLSQLVKEFEKNESYLKYKYQDQVTTIASIQKLLTKDKLIISFTIADSMLHAFIIDQQRFSYLPLGYYSSIHKNIELYVAELRNMESGRRFKGSSVSYHLYSQLIKPILALTGNTTEWVIIPDGSLYYLPFESLQEDENSRLLLEQKTISYHFSSSLLTALRTSNDKQGFDVFGLAPFIDSRGIMPALPASRAEITGLPGKILLGSKATKQAFIRDAGRFTVIHLATHAIANTDNASGSYLAFYPEAGAASNNLYLDELYGTDLDSAKLVIMSACETGDGRLINAEGVMSLSRGFAYAGVQSIVTSLWKADDEATAHITKRFHHYLNEGYSKSKALQQAKIDFLNSDHLNKTPNYWANLVLLGDPSPLVTRQRLWPWLLFASLILITTVSYLWRRNKQKTLK